MSATEVYKELGDRVLLTQHLPYYAEMHNLQTKIGVQTKLLFFSDRLRDEDVKFWIPKSHGKHAFCMMAPYDTCNRQPPASIVWGIQLLSVKNLAQLKAARPLRS